MPRTWRLILLLLLLPCADFPPRVRFHNRLLAFHAVVEILIAPRSSEAKAVIVDLSPFALLNPR